MKTMNVDFEHNHIDTYWKPGLVMTVACEPKNDSHSMKEWVDEPQD